MALDPGSADRWHNLAETYWLLRRYPEADRAFERALALNPRWGREYSYRAGVRLCQAGSVAEARSVAALAPSVTELQEADVLAEGLVRFDFAERRFDQAIARVRSLEYAAFSSQYAYLPLSYLAADALRLKGDSAGARKSYEAALQQIERELKARPDDPRLFCALGLVHAGLGQKEEALRAAQTGVDLMPISKEAYRGLFRAEDLASSSHLRSEGIDGTPTSSVSPSFWSVYRKVVPGGAAATGS